MNVKMLMLSCIGVFALGENSSGQLVLPANVSKKNGVHQAIVRFRQNDGGGIGTKRLYRR
jgi:hypothetical protein